MKTLMGKPVLIQDGKITLNEGIKEIYLKDGHLIVVLTSGITTDLGKVKGERGARGPRGTSLKNIEIRDNHLYAKLSNGIELDTGEINTFQSSATTETIQYSTMPTASADTTDKIIQYVGETGSYTNGYFYKGVHNSVQESITAEETDDLGILDDINVNATTFKSKVSGAGTYKFVKKGYPTKATFMNISTFPPITYLITRDSIFDNTLLGQYSWVDDANNYYVTNTLRPNAGTKLYSYDINTEEATDTGATYMSSNTPSTIAGYWTIQTSENIYDDANLEEYGITMSTNGYPGNEITVTYVEGSSTYTWERVNTQPDLTSISGYDSTTTQVLKNINGTLTWTTE